MNAKPIKIDLAGVLKQRLGRSARWVPGFVVKWLERLVCQDRMNALLEGAWPRRGADFCHYVMENLGVELSVRGLENMPADARVVVVSNHPLGGLDGICMISWLAGYYGRTPHFVVNDLLQAVEPLHECFVPINKHGAQSRSSSRALDEAFSGDDPVVVYPAGLVSRLQPDGSIADLRWQKMFIRKAAQHRRTVVPVFFDACNSPGFYRFALWRKRLGIKFNLEMVLLPREVFRSAGKHFRLTVGQPIAWTVLRPDDAAGQAQEIKQTVYSLANGNSIVL